MGSVLTQREMVDAIRARLQDNGRDRSFWLDNALKFSQRDTIPEHLMHQDWQSRVEVLRLAEPWLRAAAERGERFPEDDGRNLFESFLEITPWHRWFTAKVAAENGHQQMVLDLIQGHDPPKEFVYRHYDEIYLWFYIIWQFLMESRSFRHPQMQEQLWWNSLAVQGKSTHGEWTFLHFAAAKGNLACVEVLLAGHVDLDGRTKPEGYTALHLASYHDHADIVDLLLKGGAKADLRDHETGRMPLHLASERGCLASVNALLEHHSIIVVDEFKDDNGMTPLHLAACRGETEVVRKLMTFTQNPNQKCPQDLLHEKFFIARSLRRKRDEAQENRLWWRPQLIEAASSRHAILQLQPEYRLKSQVWSPGGFSALHFAVVYGNAETVREILQHGERGTVREILSTTQDNLGLTPADWAEVVDLKGKIGRVIQCSARSNAKLILRAAADGHEEGSLLQLFPSSCRKVTSCSNFGKANKHYEEVEEAERERLRVQWAVDIGEALVAKEWGEARWLITQVVKDKIKIDDVMWEHLQWAMSLSLERSRTSNNRKSLIERIAVDLVEGEAFSNSSSTMQSCLMWAMEQEMVTVVEAIVQEMVDVVKASFPNSSSTMQRCLMWAMERGMVDLVEAIVKDGGKNKCELLSVARGCDHKKSPLETATDMGGEHGSQVVAVMEQREDVQRRLYEDRQVYVDYANTILVAAVLIAALAFQGWVQSPQGYAAMSPDTNSKRMLVFARCNTLGFFLSMGAVIAGAVGAMPLRSGRLVKFREKSSRAVATASLLMVASVACEVVGFAIAVVSVEAHYRKEMLVPTRSGAIIVFLLSAWFLIRLNELQPLLDLLLHALPKTLLLPIHLIQTLLQLYPLFHTRSFQLLGFKPFYFYVFQPLKRKFGSFISESFETLADFLRTLSEAPSHHIERFYRNLEEKFKRLQGPPPPPPPPPPRPFLIP